MATTSRENLKEDVQRERDDRRERARNEIRRKRPGIRDMIVEFQPDAVEIEQRSIPGGARWTLYTIFALIAAVCLWGYFAEVDRIVSAQGKLIVDQTYVIQPAQTAPVRAIHAKFSDVVKKGQLLATLDPTFPDADVNQIEVKMRALEAVVARLTAEKNNEIFSITGHDSDPAWTNQRYAFLERQIEYQSKIREFESEHNNILVKIENNKVKIESEKEVLEVLDSLVKKFNSLASGGNASDLEREDKRLQQSKKITEIKGLDGDIKVQESEIKALESRRNAFESGWRAEVADKLAQNAQELSELKQQYNKATRTQQFVDLFVPSDLPFESFYVMEVADRSVGSVVQAGEPLFKLTPIDSPLELEIKLGDKDIGMVKIGQTVRIKLTTLPYQKHGFITGQIRSISEDAIEKESSMGMPPELSYVARVEITDSSALRDVPEAFRMRPGMLAEAEIMVGRRRVYEYFLYPLLKGLDSSIREP